jgi:hypothetical protein
MLRGIEPPLANDLIRNFGAFFCSSVVFVLRRYVSEATDN